MTSTTVATIAASPANAIRATVTRKRKARPTATAPTSSAPAVAAEPTSVATKGTANPAADAAIAVPAKPPTRAAQLLTLLTTPEGASIEKLSAHFGWLPHSARAALTGLRKAGHAVERSSVGSVTIYRVAG